MRNSKSEAIQLAAISMILNRTFGTPKQEIEVMNQGRILESLLKEIWKPSALRRCRSERETSKRAETGRRRASGSRRLTGVLSGRDVQD
jgi:hypothetical protein